MSCAECGATEVADAKACDELFKEVTGHEFGHAGLFAVHGLTVDAYCMQHPDRYMKSTKSAAAHLTGMCLSLEHGGGPTVSRRISTWLDGAVALPRVTPPPPGSRGRHTIAHVHAAAGTPEHAERVRAWAMDVWEAWQVGHEQARTWVDEVLAGAWAGGAR